MDADSALDDGVALHADRVAEVGTSPSAMAAAWSGGRIHHLGMVKVKVDPTLIFDVTQMRPLW